MGRLGFRCHRCRFPRVDPTMLGLERHTGRRSWPWRIFSFLDSPILDGLCGYWGIAVLRCCGVALLVCSCVGVRVCASYTRLSVWMSFVLVGLLQCAFLIHTMPSGMEGRMARRTEVRTTDVCKIVWISVGTPNGCLQRIPSVLVYLVDAKDTRSDEGQTEKSRRQGSLFWQTQQIFGDVFVIANK